MIYSNSENLPALKTVVPIPNWIRTASSWWTHDKIPDSEFVKVMQYMISNGMMQVHHDSSKVVHSQPIPMWMKNDADWWMNGQISDDEFVKEMQWLIDDGLIKV